MEKLKCDLRSAKSNVLLRSGKIPGIIYSKTMSNIMFEISEIDVNNVIKTQGNHGVLDVEINGEDYKAIINEVQKEPLTKKIIHLDLKEIKPENTVIDFVPVYYKGEDYMSKKGAVLQREKDNIRVRCMAKKIPHNIVMDIKNFNPGDSILVRDLPNIEEVQYLDFENTHLATIVRINKD